MKIFVAASYSSNVNYDTGEVFPEYKEWMESVLTIIEGHGHTVFCALRADDYKINDSDPVAAFFLDKENLNDCDVMLAIVTDKPSVGVQTEIGYAIAKGKTVVLAHELDQKLAYFNGAMNQAGVVAELVLPFTQEKFDLALGL